MKTMKRPNKSSRLITFLCVNAVILTLSLSACSQKPVPKQTITKNENNSHNQLIHQAQQITIKHKLSKLPLTCLQFDVLNQRFKGKQMINVREKHGGDCKGDLATAPRLYSISIDESTGELWSDALSPLGSMEKLGQEK